MAFPALVYHAAGRATGSRQTLWAVCATAWTPRAVSSRRTSYPLADGAYALLHDRFLEDETNGKGSVAAATGRRWVGCAGAGRVS